MSGVRVHLLECAPLEEFMPWKAASLISLTMMERCRPSSTCELVGLDLDGGD